MSIIGESATWKLAEENGRVAVTVATSAASVVVGDGWATFRVPRELWLPLAAEWHRHATEAAPESGDLLDHLVSTVSEVFRLRIGKVLADKSGRRPQQARHLIWYLARKHGRLSFPEIARPFHMDHTSVLKAVKKMEALIEAGDPTFDAHIAEVERRMRLGAAKNEEGA